MKLRITIEQKSYDVEVELLDPAPHAPLAPLATFATLPSAASRVEGAPVNTASRPTPARSIAHAFTPPPTPTPTPAKPLEPWHGLSVGPAGELLAPVAGVVRELFVKVGDRVKAYEPLLTIEVSKVVAPQDKPLLGTIRATQAGVVADVCITAGATVAFGQQLVRFNP